MTKGWDWVIGTGLYVAALVLSWLTLFSIERFGAAEVKAWAPFLQAVLSAAAIFVAWFLQDQKRKADRREAEADSVLTAMHLIADIEWALGEMLSLRLQNDLHLANLRAAVLVLEQSDAMLRRLNFGHLQPSSTEAVLRILSYATQAVAFGQSRVESGKAGKIELGSVYLGLYTGIYAWRSLLINRHGGAWLSRTRRAPSSLRMEGDEAERIDEPAYLLHAF